MKFFTPNDEALDAERNKDARQIEEQGGIKPFYLKSGVTMLQVLPPFSERGVWYRELLEYNFKVDGQRYLYSAPSQFDLPDPFEEKRQELIAAGGDENLKLAEQLKIQRKYLMNVLVWAAPPSVEFNKGEVTVVKVPLTVKRQILELDRDVQGGWADLTNPENAVILKVTRTGEGLQTRYTTIPNPKRVNLKESLAQIGKDIDNLKLHNLDELYTPLPYDELKLVAAKLGSGLKTSEAVVNTPVVETPVPEVKEAAPVADESFVPGLDIPPPPVANE